MILITAPKGNIGRELLKEMSRLGQPVRAGVRDSRSIPTERPPAVQWVEADLDDEESLAVALEGVEKLFLLSPGPDIRAQDHNGIAAARRAGVRHVVLLSSSGVSNATGSGPAHIPGESELVSSGLQWTILRPAALMSNALFQWLPTIRAQSAFYQATGDGKHATIHPADVGEVAAKVLTSSGHEGKIYELTGPDALSADEQAATLSRVLGRTIKYVDVPEAAFRTQLLEALPPGLPDAVIAAILKFYAVVKAGQYGTVTPTVELILGHRGRTFEEWVCENSALFS
jgi:uncharacterized protein YbjT (DUF2867 family)